MELMEKLPAAFAEASENCDYCMGMDGEYAKLGEDDGDLGASVETAEITCR